MKDKIVIKVPSRPRRKCPLNPKVGIDQDHYAWLCELSDKTGKTCSALNNLFYELIRKSEIVIEEENK